MITLENNTIMIDGEWTLAHLTQIQVAAEKFDASAISQDEITIDGSKLTKLDTMGCQELYIALKSIPESCKVNYQGFEKKELDLYLFIKSRVDDVGVQKCPSWVGQGKAGKGDRPDTI